MATRFDPWAAADLVFAAARSQAGDGITCHSGCDDCCRRPFAITAADAARLREGLAELPHADRVEILARSAEAWSKMRPEFPGTDEGFFDAPDDWREWFFGRWHGTPCPVLDLTTGGCRLYGYRPVACRLYGPLIQIGGMESSPCPKCFPGWTAEAVSATRVSATFPDAEPGPETIIPAALTVGGTNPAPPGPLHQSSG